MSTDLRMRVTTMVRDKAAVLPELLKLKESGNFNKWNYPKKYVRWVIKTNKIHSENGPKWFNKSPYRVKRSRNQVT
jgi:hypothetical protein